MSRSLGIYKPADLADELGITEHTLWRWRKDGTGPPWTRIGRHVVYPIGAFDAWLGEQARANVKAG